jgi:hypothetical protein
VNLLTIRLATRQRKLPLNRHNTFIPCVAYKGFPVTSRKLALEMQGYQVITARSVTDAIRVFNGHPLDLVLIDQVMPRWTGTDFAQSVKKGRPDHYPMGYLREMDNQFSHKERVLLGRAKNSPQMPNTWSLELRNYDVLVTRIHGFQVFSPAPSRLSLVRLSINLHALD